MDIKYKIRFFLIITVVLGTLLGCNLFNQGDTEYASVSINVPSSRTLVDSVYSYTLTVTADDMDEQTVTFSEDSVSLEVSAGVDRTFSLIAYDSYDDILYEGNQTVDLDSGESVSLTITLFSADSEDSEDTESETYNEIIDADEYEPDDSASEADTNSRFIELDVEEYHTSDTGDDEDWAKFEVTEMVSYTFYTSDTGNGKSVDTILYLYDTDGITELTSNDDSTDLYSSVSYTFGTTDIYYIMVKPFSESYIYQDFYLTVTQD